MVKTEQTPAGEIARVSGYCAIKRNKQEMNETCIPKFGTEPLGEGSLSIQHTGKLREIKCCLTTLFDFHLIRSHFSQKSSGFNRNKCFK